ncbi:hypothetical protein BHE74_00021405 [Ensete ventricosum]|nr:hypothetical protein BHE74_00021405 [Ensete ventricosum]RZS25459.1 hypothetical protein BHM03_00058663 [Ensete ventricosum]
MSKNLVTLHLQKLVKRKVQTHCELEPAIGYRPSKLRPHHLPSLFESFQPRSWPELQRLVSSSLTHVLDRENRIKSEAREIEEFDPLAIPWFTVAVAFGDRNVNMGTKAEEEEEEVRSLGHCLLRRGRRSRGQKREHGHDIELDSLLGRASKRRHTWYWSRDTSICIVVRGDKLRGCVLSASPRAKFVADGLKEVFDLSVNEG